MDWKLFFATFGAIFIAEIGDKTQLATLAFAGGGSSRWVVFVAASLALVATTAIAVIAGAALTRYISPHWIQRGAGALFVVLGVIFLVTSAPRATPPEAPPPAAEAQPLPAE